MGALISCNNNLCCNINKKEIDINNLKAATNNINAIYNDDIIEQKDNESINRTSNKKQNFKNTITIKSKNQSNEAKEEDEEKEKESQKEEENNNENKLENDCENNSQKNSEDKSNNNDEKNNEIISNNSNKINNKEINNSESSDSDNENNKSNNENIKNNNENNNNENNDNGKNENKNKNKNSIIMWKNEIKSNFINIDKKKYETTINNNFNQIKSLLDNKLHYYYCEDPNENGIVSTEDQIEIVSIEEANDINNNFDQKVSDNNVIFLFGNVLKSSNSSKTVSLPIEQNKNKNYQPLNEKEKENDNEENIIKTNKKSSKKINLLKNNNTDSIKGNFKNKKEKICRFLGNIAKKTKKKKGYGRIIWCDNSTLEGNYSNSDILNDICKFHNTKNNSTFSGYYQNNFPKGYGIYSTKNLSLQGYWENNILNGIAIEVWEDGTYYQGEYENNKKNGIGLYRWPDGTIYQGEFLNDQMTGYGLTLYSDDCIFSGELSDGYMNGYGTFIWGNGTVYMGYYLQDIKHGFGVYVWDTKSFICYIGFWEMGKQQGIGAKVNGNKIKYCLWNKGKITSTLKGLYEIERYLTGVQKKYYHYFTTAYITKLKANIFNNVGLKNI